MTSILSYKTLEKADIHDKRVLVRVDFDVPLDDGTIEDDTRINVNIPTLQHLLKKNNKLILIAKLGRPKGRDPKLSLIPIAEALPKYIEGVEVRLIDDFMKDDVSHKHDKEILLLENIRFYDDKTRNSPMFLDKLASLGDVFVNDAFAMAHRDEVTITGLPKKLPSYAGFSLDTEVRTLLRVIDNPKKPVVSIIGGAKIETKVEPIKKLIDISDHVLIGGAIGNTFLKAHGYDIGRSLYDESEVKHAKELITYAESHAMNLELPIDARVGSLSNEHAPAYVVNLPTLPDNGHILDIGPRTADIYASIIATAKTVIWNGPMGLYERDEFKAGTDEVYRAIIHNLDCFSVIGGGDTVGALARKRQKHGIDHISSGGGAMLSLIEHGDLPAIKALRDSH